MITFLVFVVFVALAVGGASWFLVEQWHQFRRLARLAAALDGARDRFRVVHQVQCGCVGDRAAAGVLEVDEVLKRTDLEAPLQEWKRGGSR